MLALFVVGYTSSSWLGCGGLWVDPGGDRQFVARLNSLTGSAMWLETLVPEDTADSVSMALDREGNVLVEWGHRRVTI